MFSDPVKNVEQFGLKQGQTVVDLGSGSGHYSLAAARAVGETGHVYAVDVQKDMLTRLKNEANRQGFFNVEVIWGDIEKPSGTKLKDGIADAAIISNLMFQIADKESVVKETFRILKPGGLLLLVDWSSSFGGLGPAPESVFSKDKATALFGGAGFNPAQEVTAGEHHYGIVFKRK